MFDLRKRHSMILGQVASNETEEFRRVALRRRSKGALVDDHASHTVPPKPAHLQTSERAPQKDPSPQHLKPTHGVAPHTDSQRTQGGVLLKVIPVWHPITPKSPAGTRSGSRGAGSGGVHASVSPRRTTNCRTDEDPSRPGGTVPQLVVHLDGSSPTVDRSERSPLKPLQFANCTVSISTMSTTTPSQSPACKRMYCTTGTAAQRVECRGVSTDPPPGPEAPGPEHQGEALGEGGLRPASGTDRKERLYHIAMEVLMTERAYVARLHLLDQVFCSRLSEEASRGSFPIDVVKNIFSNLSSIHSFHSQFLLPDLEERMLHWGDRPGLGDILLRHAPFLRMYAEYLGNFEPAMGLLRTWRERSAAFRAVLQDVQSQEVCGSLSLEHHMLEPVQRVPQALEAISMAAGHSENAIHRAESLRRLLGVFEMVGEEEILKPSSELLREGRLVKLAARNTSAMDRYLFLFNNFLLCCTPKLSLVGQRYGVRTRIGVEGMQVQRTTNEDHPYSFQISGKEKTLELEASSERDRDDWITVIQEAIDVFHEKHESFKLASKEFDLIIPEAELGRRAPRWIRDNEVVECVKCREPFNAITRRRHHCRACGCVVCWKCSEHKVALEYDGNRLNKVCNACHRFLSTRELTDAKGGRSLQDTGKSVVASSGGAIGSFLTYGDDPKACRRVWSVVTQSQPAMLHLFSTQQESSPLLSIPLLGSSVEESPRLSAELQDPWRFCLVHAAGRHTFLCDGPELKGRWLAVLRKSGTADTEPAPPANR
ncbi:hypothetical protein NHX12_020336 [Muraenolepis orangiensis]|uniref:FYVE, RhoGEF and PH domain-containing protein 4 n=1 Tax=Muraenolepis orangiensis TaxID=630683 RepID=A0A9Q0ER95_9TELE|nr:hypothetical protein NHX12_020336 [Muraenolepis orangiensis]